MGLFIGCTAVFVYLFTLIYFDYIRCVQENMFVDWDVKTITAGDYTVSFDINVGVYEKFLEKYYDPANPISENNQFKLYVKDELEKRLTLFPDLGIDDDKSDGGPKEMKVAIVTCAFDNSKIINWLRDRGDAIKDEDWDKLDRINDTIRKNLKRDSQLLDKLQRPCSLFVTFESEEA